VWCEKDVGLPHSGVGFRQILIERKGLAGGLLRFAPVSLSKIPSDPG
jgi:hypothetical protein